MAHLPFGVVIEVRAMGLGTRSEGVGRMMLRARSGSRYVRMYRESAFVLGSSTAVLHVTTDTYLHVDIPAFWRRSFTAYPRHITLNR